MEHWQVSYAVDKFTEDFTEASREKRRENVFSLELPPREVRRSVDAADSMTNAEGFDLYRYGSFDSFDSFDSSYCASV